MDWDPSSFEQIVDRKIDFIATEAICRAWVDSSLYASVLGTPELAAHRGLVLYSRWLVSLEDLARVEQWTLNRGAATFAHVFCLEGEKAGQALLDFSASLPSDFSSEPNGTLFEWLRRFDVLAQPLVSFLWPTHPIARTIEREVRKAVLAQQAEPDLVEQFVATLCFPEKENTPVTENRALMCLALLLLDADPSVFTVSGLPSAALRRDFEDHSARFGFLGARGIGSRRWVADDFYRRAADLAKDPSLLENFRKSQADISHHRAETDTLMDSLGFSESERKLVAAAKEIVYFRTFRTEVMYRAFSDLDGLLSELGRCFGYSLRQMKQLSIPEILSLPDQKIPSPLADQRETRFGLLMDSGTVTVLDPDALDRLERSFSVSLEGQSHLKGTPACRGQACGTVRIVKTVNDLQKVQPGDVLIAPMTTPDFLPAMQRASAFVTDEGGMTCHAAIVAREMNKPCVIGTKNATRFFKDGDRVEVDGTGGFVQRVA